MSLKRYLHEQGYGSASSLASRMRLPPALISQWANGRRPVPAERCPDIEAATGVPCEELRPDVAWHVLRGKPLPEKGGGMSSLQVALAASLGASEATISRIKNERLQECLAFLYAVGFKVVPQGRVCVDPAKLDAVMTLARAAMGDEATARKLVWEDE